MIRNAQSRLRRRWPLLTLAGILATGGTVAGLRLQSLVREQLPGYLDSKLEAALGRPVEFGAVYFWPTGVWVDDLRVSRLPGERVDPLTARRLRVSLDWWHLLSTQKLRVGGVDLEFAKLRLTSGSPGKPGQPWTAQIAALSNSGLERFGLRNASIQMLAAGPARAAWAAEGVDGDLRAEGARFTYAARVRSYAGGPVALSGIRLTGTGDAGGVLVKEARADYQGSRVEARGSVKAAGNAVAMTVRVKDMGLAQLAPKLGIPAEWALKGRLTGQVTVDARDNSLRSVRGSVRMDRGSFTRAGGRFPWKSASAVVHWTPDSATLRNVKVTGEGVVLTADGEILLAAGQPLTSGKFSLSGRIQAEQGRAVAQVAELLAFRRVLDGRWQAGKAAVEFTAAGMVADLSHASASGRLRAEDLRFRPTPESEQVIIARVDADLKRTHTELTLDNVRAQTDGFVLTGSATLTDDRPGKPAQLLASGFADVKDLKSLRKAVPQASLWKLAPALPPTASGIVRFRLGGPSGQPQHMWSSGSFEIRSFRLSARSPLPSGAVFFIPVEVARGSFRHEGARLDLHGLELKTRTFDAGGTATLTFGGGEPRLTTELRLATDDWRSLPAMPVGVLPELTGGRFEALVKVQGAYARLSEAPVDGSFRLTGASYTPPLTDPERGPVPVRELSAQFRWANRVLELPSVTVDTPLLTATAYGQIRPDGDDYRLALDVEARTGHAAEMASRFTQDLKLTGGTAEASLHVDAPVQSVQTGSLGGTVVVHDVKALYALEALGLKEIDARTLTVDFSGQAGHWNVGRLALDAPGLNLSLNGAVSSHMVDAGLKVRAENWNAPEASPVTGGGLELDGRLTGDPAKPQELAFAGGVKLEGASARYAGPRAAVKGGVLELSASGQGPIGNLVAWVQSGKVAMRDADATIGGRREKLELASASFERAGDRFLVQDARVAGAGVTASGSGEWSPERHALTVTADARDLARLGFRLPEGVSAKQYRLTAKLSGSGADPAQALDGRIELEGVRVALAGAPEQSFGQVAGEFSYAGGRLQLRKLEGSGPAGTVQASGELSKTGRRLSVAVFGDDFSRLGVRLSQGLVVKGYRLEANVSGTGEKPVSTGSGWVKLAGVQFPFGPGASHRLDTLSTRFRLDGRRVVLSDIEATGPAGHATGSGELNGKAFRIALDGPQVDPGVVCWLLPGMVQGSRVAATVVVEGRLPKADEALVDAVKVATGRFELKDAVYSIPETLSLLGSPAQVGRFAGAYRWEKGRTTITDMSLDADLLDGTGTLTLVEGQGRIQADLRTADLGRVAGFWPALAGKFRSGSATGKLDARFGEAGTRGTLALQDRGGSVIFPTAPAEYAEHPVETGGVLLNFEPGKIAFSGVKIRGPKGNADGEGVWTDNGPVYATGKAWFSKSFTSKLIKPSGFGWLAKLVGIREVKSDFTLSGTSNDVRLHAGITRGFLWKFAKGRVPKEFQDIARGKAPLWVTPLEVAQQPTAPAGGKP
jgi:hypothetical protein